MAKGAAQRYPVYTTAKANLAALAWAVAHQLRDGRRRARRTGHQRRDAATGSGQTVRPRYGPLGGDGPGRFHAQRGQSTLSSPPEPVTANPGTVNSDGSPNKPNVGVGFAAGTGGGYGPDGVNGSRVFLPFGLDPAPRRSWAATTRTPSPPRPRPPGTQLPPRSPGPSAGDDRRRRRDLVLRRGGRLQLRPVAEAAVGRARGRTAASPALGEVQPIDVVPRRTPGAICASRWPGRRRRPTSPASSPTTRTCPTTSGSRFTPPRVPVLETAQQFLGSQTPVLMDIATAANFPCQRPFSERLGVAELPEYRILPELQAGGGVVEPVAVRRGRRPVPVHPGAADAPRPSRPTCATTGTATGVRSNAMTAWCPPPRHPTPSSTRASTTRVRLDAAADRSGHCHDRGTARPLRHRRSGPPAMSHGALGRDGRRPDRLRAGGADAAAAGGADHRDAELAAERALTTSPRR